MSMHKASDGIWTRTIYGLAFNDIFQCKIVIVRKRIWEYFLLFSDLLQWILPSVSVQWYPQATLLQPLINQTSGQTQFVLVTSDTYRARSIPWWRQSLRTASIDSRHNGSVWGPCNSASSGNRPPRGPGWGSPGCLPRWAAANFRSQNSTGRK